MKAIELEVCNRCNLNREDELLHDLAYSEDRYIHDLVKKTREEPGSPLAQEALKQLSQRLDDQEEECEEETEGLYSEPNQEDGDEPGVPGRNEIQEEDILNALKEREEHGLIDIKDGKVIVTSRGVKKLAAEALQRILRSLQHRNTGVHREKPELGVELSLRTRRYEAGDDYSLVDLEKTALNALNRCGEFKFEPEDFEIREEEHRAKLCAGIIIDESGSMRDSGKFEAAMETSLVLSRLIMREPDNVLKVFAFSDKVRRLEPWAIINDVISGGDTDIRGALAAFRRECRKEQGDKQAYLITDTEPNNEDGRHLSFENAANGLIEEASRYRQEKIGLNIIMLDEGPELKKLASTIAKKGLGRVFFTVPETIGEVVIEDYLSGRR
ncbi:MAG: hypothetical protein JW762_04210 [Dehalococcoidales bacterium]|nr:hypothetical protein [Dehalococcoidales bacterium]